MTEAIWEQMRPTGRLLGNLYIHGETGIHPVPAHWHPELEVNCYLSTPVELVLKGESFSLPAGAVALVPGGEVHSLTPHKADAPEGISVFFTPALLRQNDAGFDRTGFLRGPVENPALAGAMAALLAQWKAAAGDPLGHLLLNARFCELLHCLLRDCRTAYAPPGEGSVRQWERCRQAPDFLAGHFRGPVGREGPGAALGLSAPHLSRLFRRCLGTGFKAHLQSLRLDWALGQLDGWEGGLLDLALAAGFADYRAFCAAFRRRFGVTPLQYQKGRQMGEEPFSHAPWIGWERGQENTAGPSGR